MRRGESLEALAPLEHDFGRMLRPHLVGNRLQSVGDEVAAGEHGEHAGRRHRRAGVDAADPGMGMGRAHHDRVDLARQVHVVGIAAVAGDEFQILAAADRLSDMGADGFLVHGFALCLFENVEGTLPPLALPSTARAFPSTACGGGVGRGPSDVPQVAADRSSRASAFFKSRRRGGWRAPPPQPSPASGRGGEVRMAVPFFPFPTQGGEVRMAVPDFSSPACGLFPSTACGGGVGRGLSDVPQVAADRSSRASAFFLKPRRRAGWQAPPPQPSPASGRGGEVRMAVPVFSAAASEGGGSIIATPTPGRRRASPSRRWRGHGIRRWRGCRC